MTFIFFADLMFIVIRNVSYYSICSYSSLVILRIYPGIPKKSDHSLSRILGLVDTRCFLYSLHSREVIIVCNNDFNSNRLLITTLLYNFT